MFVTLEGIEGSGKTTQMKYIDNFLKEKGFEYCCTREPGGTRIGQKIRGILLDPENKDIVSEVELLLYMADRVQHINTIIKPALADGKIVVCDRFHDATRVYQGDARGIDLGLIGNLYKLVVGDFMPDITFLLDLPASVGLDRALRGLKDGERIKKESRFEEETLGFHEKVRGGYLRETKWQPWRWVVIDARKTEEEVARRIINEIQQRLAVFGKLK